MYHNPINKKAYGFTIVELLIVIVVIAILAAISIVAYTGIQQKAKNSQVISVVETYQKAFSMYRTTKGTSTVPYPNQTSGLAYTNCLGTGYEYDGDHCQYQEGSPGDTATESSASQATLRSILSEYIQSTPNISPMKYYDNGSGVIRSGAVYLPGRDDVTTATTNTHKPRIVYYLNGANQDCSIGGAVRSSTNWGGTGATLCVVYLPY